MDELFLLADGALSVRRTPEVLRDPQKLGLSVANFEPAEAAAPVLLYYRLTHESVLDPARTRVPTNPELRLRAAADARHQSQATVPATPVPTEARSKGAPAGRAT